MSDRALHGIPLRDRAILVIGGNLLIVAVAELTLGVAYGEWWGDLIRTFLLAELAAFIAWVFTDPDAVDRFLASVFGSCWRWLKKTIGGVDDAHDASPRSNSRNNPLAQLARWYGRPPIGKLNRPLQWAFLWVCTFLSLYAAMVLIVGTGGGTRSPFVQLPLLIVVMGGMLSDRAWNSIVLIVFGGSYSVLVIYEPDAALLGTPPIVASAYSATDQKLATAIVTVASLALGVLAAYVSTEYRRQERRVASRNAAVRNVDISEKSD